MTSYKPIPDYEGIYEAGSDGTIWTCKGKTTYCKLADGTFQSRVWKRRRLKFKHEIRKGSTRKDARVELWKNGSHKTKLVSSLVASAFIPNPRHKPCINHIDGNPLNNKQSNLEWCYYAENMKHAYLHNLNQANSEIVLCNLESKECLYFYSEAKASIFLGKNPSFLNEILSKGKNEINGYKIFVA